MSATIEMCGPCASAGFPNVKAAYKGTPAGMSHTGKAIPSMCWDHRNNRTPSYIREQQTTAIAEVAYCVICAADGDKKIATRETAEGDPVCEACLKAWDEAGPAKIVPQAPPKGYAVFNKEKEMFEGQNRPEPVEIDKVQAVELYKSGLSWSEVSKKMGVAQHRVYNACRKLIDCDRNMPPAVSSASKVVRQTISKEITAQVTQTEEVEHWTQGKERLSRLHIELPSGGRLTLEMEAHLFEISAEDRAFVFALVDKMRSYAMQKAVALPRKHFSIVSAIEHGFIVDRLDMMDQEQQNEVIDWVQDAAEVVKERRAGQKK